MSKFNVLQNSQRFMGTLGIYGDTRPSNRAIFMLLTLSNLMAFCVWKLFHSNDLNDKLFAVFAIIGYGQSVAVFTNIILKLDLVAVLHRKIQSIVRNGSFFFHFLSLFNQSKKKYNLKSRRRFEHSTNVLEC